MAATNAPDRGPGIGTPAQRVSSNFPGVLGRPWAVLVLAVVVVGGITIRAYRVSERSLWFDEAFTWRLTDFPFGEMLRRITLDNSPPLYYILLKLWTACFGTSVLAMRSLSILMAGVTIVGMYLFIVEASRDDATGEETTAADAGGARPHGLLAAALVAVSAFQVRWAWDVRMYTLGTALATLSSWALFRALQAPGHAWRKWAVYGFLTLLFAYCHNYALFSIAAQVIFLLGLLLRRCRWNPEALARSKTFLGAMVAAGIVLVGWLPWLPFFLRMRAQVQANYWTRPLTWWDLLDTCYEMFVEPENGHLKHSTSLITGLLCGTCLLALLWRKRAADWYVFVAAAAPIGFGALVSLLDTQIFHLRYLLFSHLFLLAGISVLVRRVTDRRVRTALYVLVPAAFLAGYVSFWHNLDVGHKPGARAASAWIAGHRQPDEPVIVCSPLLYFPLLYHAADRAGYHVYARSERFVHYEGSAALMREDMITREELTNLASRRAWVVNMTGWGGRRVPVPKSWVHKGQARFSEVLDFQGDIIVIEYEIPDRRHPSVD